jgi:transposase-like protein
MQSKEQLREQKFAMIAAWQQSGLTQKQYCIQNNIAYHVFHYWYKQYRARYNLSDKKQSSFVQLQVQPSSSVAAAELLLTDGRRLIFHQAVSSEYLKSLIS